MTTYEITSRDTGLLCGRYVAVSVMAALAAMHCDAGYDVTLNASGTRLVFESDYDTDMCGGLEDWSVRAV
jgi:hypothetical protein